MARRRRQPLVPEARAALDQLKLEVMANKGFKTNIDNPEAVKFEVASAVGVSLQEGYNGRLTSKEAGKVGGQIGGSMVKELIRMAKQRMEEK